MAIKLNDGRYIKLSLHDCNIDYRGIHVGFYEYKSQEEKQNEYLRIVNIENFIQNVSDYIENNIKKIEKEINISNITSQEQLNEALNDEQREIIETCNSLHSDLSLFNSAIQVGETSVEKQFKNLALMKQLGYKSEYLTKLHVGNLRSEISGALINQKFTYTDMYKELKKIFKKDGFIDC